MMKIMMIEKNYFHTIAIFTMMMTIILSESYPMNTNMTGFKWFSIIFESLRFE